MVSAWAVFGEAWVDTNGGWWRWPQCVSMVVRVKVGQFAWLITDGRGVAQGFLLLVLWIMLVNVQGGFIRIR